MENNSDTFYIWKSPENLMFKSDDPQFKQKLTKVSDINFEIKSFCKLDSLDYLILFFGDPRYSHHPIFSNFFESEYWVIQS